MLTVWDAEVYPLQPLACLTLGHRLVAKSSLPAGGSLGSDVMTLHKCNLDFRLISGWLSVSFIVCLVGCVAVGLIGMTFLP